MQILEECQKIRDFLIILDKYTQIYSCFITVKEKEQKILPFNLRNIYKKPEEFIVDRHRFVYINDFYVSKLELLINYGVIYKVIQPEITIFNHNLKVIKSDPDNIHKEQIIIDKNFKQYNVFNTIDLMEIQDVRKSFNISCS